MRRSFLVSCFLMMMISGFSQEILDRYIQIALGSNITLQQKELSYTKSLAALKEAKALFLPRLSLEARYSVARGGRAFVLPIGDLMNPVYDNLNLINSLGQASSPDYPVIPNYPMIQNEEINFLRETEHETLLRVFMPVFNSAILQNHKINRQLTAAEQVGVDIYKRELVKEVKTAYFNYLKAVEAYRLFEQTLELVEENVRTTESLQRNHKVTPDAVFAAQAEVKSVEQQLAEAEKNVKVAKAYFNFLLNREYETDIEFIKDDLLPVSVVSVEQSRAEAFQKREEFRQLEHFESATDNKIQLNKGNRLPQVNLVVDYGFQGTEYSFTSEDDFALGSLVMSWNLLDFSNKSKVEQAQIEKFELVKRREEVKQQIGLQVVNAYYDLEAAQKSITAVTAEQAAAQSAFRLVNRKYEQGQSNLVAFIRARTQLTTASQKLIIAKFDYQEKLAILEQARASYTF